jgi:hypothetical protein
MSDSKSTKKSILIKVVDQKNKNIKTVPFLIADNTTVRSVITEMNLGFNWNLYEKKGTIYFWLTIPKIFSRSASALTLGGNPFNRLKRL